MQRRHLTRFRAGRRPGLRKSPCLSVRGTPELLNDLMAGMFQRGKREQCVMENPGPQRWSQSCSPRGWRRLRSRRWPQPKPSSTRRKDARSSGSTFPTTGSSESDRTCRPRTCRKGRVGAPGDLGAPARRRRRDVDRALVAAGRGRLRRVEGLPPAPGSTSARWTPGRVPRRAECQRAPGPHLLRHRRPDGPRFRLRLRRRADRPRRLAWPHAKAAELTTPGTGTTTIRSTTRGTMASATASTTRMRTSMST